MAQFIVAGVLLILSALVGFANLAGTWKAISNQRQGIDGGYSSIPLFSLLFASIAYFVFPFEPKWWIALVPLCAPGTWSLIVLPFFLIREYWKHRKV